MAVLDVFQVRLSLLDPRHISIPISRRFLVEDARLVKIEEFRKEGAHEGFGTSFDQSIEHSKEMRAKGGVGTGMKLVAVSLNLEVNGIMNFTQMNAFTTTRQDNWTDLRDSFSVEPNWLDVLKIAVAQGWCL
jgi:hypothetical protein